MQLHKQIHHHFRKHHKKYIFGLTLGGVGFFVVKVIISTVGFMGVFNDIRGVFAADFELNSGNITQAPFNCATSATSCSLGYKGITSIARDTFVNHTSLQTLSLNYNQITSIEEGAFNGLISLQELTLSNNQLTGVESGDFNGPANLTKLYLDSNQLTSIATDTFVNYTGLQRLKLSNNQITSVESGDFNGLTSLGILEISNNQLTSIESGDFSGLVDLLWLHLGGNHITNIESGDFNGLANLTKLFLDYNQLTSIEEGDFNGLTNLMDLYLGGNQLTSIESGDFNGLTNLISLRLYENQLTSIESGDFNGPTGLQVLYLNNNQLTGIELGSFNGLTGLVQLYLQDNRIVSIESGSFTDLNKISLFNINNNKICIGSLPSSIIQFIDNKFKSTARQSTQDISSCPVMGCTDPEAINYNAAATDDNGGCVYPIMGCIDVLAENYNEAANTDDGSCTYIYGCINTTAKNYNSGAAIDDGSCIIELNSGNVTQAPFNCVIDAIQCDLSNQGITSIATGTFVNHTGLQRLYLSNNKLSTLSNGIFQGLSTLYQLDISYNTISEIQTGSFDGLSQLQYLSLYENQITSIESGDFNGLTILTYLDLVYNQISSIESGALNGLTGLTYLGLYDNCLNTEDTTLTDYLNTIYWTDYSSQHVCIKIDYTPSTATTGSVVGGLYFTGPTSYVTSLETDNPDMSIYDYIYTSNGTHAYDYSSIVDNNGYLLTSYLGYPDIVTGNVTWIEAPADIEAPTITGITNGSVYTTSVTFTVTDNVGVASVTLNGSSLGSWTSYTVSTVGTYILVAKDAADNMTTINFEVKAASSASAAGGGGGGGGGGMIKDKCPNGDYTKSLYDGKCGEKPTVATGSVINTGHGVANIINSSIEIIKSIIPSIIENIVIPPKQEIINNIEGHKSAAAKEELAEAYQFALENQITTITNLGNVEFDAVLKRIHMAKMVSNYAINVMGKTGTVFSSGECKFNDLGGVSDELKIYANIACQLGLMGQDGKGGINKKFNPYGEVTRAQFGAILSRLLRGDKYNKAGGDWYKSHLSALNKIGIMKEINIPSQNELRGRVMVMMKRASDTLTKK